MIKVKEHLNWKQDDNKNYFETEMNNDDCVGLNSKIQRFKTSYRGSAASKYAIHNAKVFFLLSKDKRGKNMMSHSYYHVTSQFYEEPNK